MSYVSLQNRYSRCRPIDRLPLLQWFLTASGSSERRERRYLGLYPFLSRVVPASSGSGVNSVACQNKRGGRPRASRLGLRRLDRWRPSSLAVHHGAKLMVSLVSRPTARREGTALPSSACQWLLFTLGLSPELPSLHSKVRSVKEVSPHSLPLLMLQSIHSGIKVSKDRYQSLSACTRRPQS
jgi:hypothetical protein